MVTSPTSPAEALPPVAEGAGTGATALWWEAPADWTSEPPANAMRRAQYTIDGRAGAGECVVYYFGPGQGGDPVANAERWASQFLDEEGRPNTASMSTRSEEIHGIAVLFVEASGAYRAGAMAGGRGGAPRQDWALLGAIASGPDANWFFKLTGPRETVAAARTAFETMLRSLRYGD